MEKYSNAIIFVVLAFIFSTIGVYSAGGFHSKSGMQKRTAKVIDIGDKSVVVYTSSISSDLERRTYYAVPKDRLLDFNRQDSTATYFAKDADKVNTAVVLN